MIRTISLKNYNYESFFIPTKCSLNNLSQVAELLDVFPVGLDFVMVFEYMPSGLWEVIRDTERPLNESEKKTYVKMLIEGVSYMHANNVMHRVW